MTYLIVTLPSKNAPVKKEKKMGVVVVTALMSALLLGARAAAAEVYTFKGDPFQPGPLNVTTLILNKNPDGIPVHTAVYYPTNPGTYAPVVFVPGVYGAIIAEWHSVVLTHFASYGYIVAGVDLLWPLIGGAESPMFPGPKSVFEVIQWLTDNLNQRVLPGQGAVNVSAEWKDLGLMSHSLGADILVQMLQQNHTLARAVAFLEPASTHLSKPLGFSIPALSYGTQLCMEAPKCCNEKYGYFHFYDELVCPKILMNVTGYGHCDILNETPGWNACRLIHFCKIDQSNDRDLYREVFLPGVLSGLFGAYLQDNGPIIKYITTRDMMPVPLGQLESDLQCTI